MIVGRQQAAADEVEDHVFPDGADGDLAIGEEVQRVGVAVGELDNGFSSLK